MSGLLGEQKAGEFFSSALFMVALCFVVAGWYSPAMAQEENGPIAEDGTLLSDFERAEQQWEQDPTEQGARQKDRLIEPQDPLNQSYNAQKAQVLDRQDKARRDGRTFLLLPTPLQEAPRDFRDDELVERLAREAQREWSRNDHSWRQRDQAAFDPSGISVGSFVLYPEFTTGVTMSNNLFATKHGRKTDLATDYVPAFRLHSDWNRHELRFFAKSHHRRWSHFSSENTDEFELRARGRLDVTRRTSLEGGARYEQKFEGRGSNELPDAASRPAKTHQSEIFGQVNHRFNRLGFRLRGQLIKNQYDNVALNSGAILNNHLRDYDERLGSLRTSYEFSPRLTVFADEVLGKRVFDHRLDGNHFVQGSSRWLTAIGTRLELSAQLSLLGRVGYARVNPDEARYADLQGFVYDGRLIWQPSAFSTLNVRGKTEFVETTQSGSAGSFNRSLSADLEHFWTHRLSSHVKAAYEVRDYSGISQIDRELRLGVSARYLFSRALALEGGYEHTLVRGTNAYEEDVLHLGLKWQR